jgi:hypothetical protein
MNDVDNLKKISVEPKFFKLRKGDYAWSFIWLKRFFKIAKIIDYTKQNNFFEIKLGVTHVVYELNLKSQNIRHLETSLLP